MAPEEKGRRPGQLPPGRHGLDPDFVASSQRTRLLTGVIDAVAELGYQSTRITDILAKSGVSRRTFYDNFDEKDECFLAAYDVEVAHFTETASAAFYGDGSMEWPDQIRAGVRALLRYLAEHQAAARVCIVEVDAAGPPARGKRDTAVRGFTYFIDAGRGTAKHEVPGRTALAVIGGILELIETEIKYGSTGQLESLAPDAVYLAVLPFLGPEGATAQRELTRVEIEKDKKGPVLRKASAKALADKPAAAKPAKPKAGGGSKRGGAASKRG